MELSTWLLFSVVALASTLSPGPAVLLSVTNSLRYGVKAAVYSSLGNIFGIFLVSGAASMGLGAILQTSVVLFSTLKFLGAAFLIYLGIRQWRTRKNPKRFSKETGRTVASSHFKSFFQGILVAVSNPKAVLFFTALFPQFMDISKPMGIQFLILTATFMTLSFLSLVAYAISTRSAGNWLSCESRARWFNRITGTLFIGLGLGMLRLKNRTA